jgi:hypothetical protein
MKAILASWRTTITGILMVTLALAAMIVLRQLDQLDAGTSATLVGIMLAGFGFIQARDAKVSSQDSGVRPEPPSR